jgi:uncharacterized protein
VISDAPIRRVGILLTRSCNLACAYCYQDRTSRRRLTWPVLRDRLSELLQPGLVDVTFSGGEPLMEYPLIQKTVRAARALEFGCVAFRWQLLTNGLLLDAGRLEWLRSHRFTIQLSLQVDPAQPAAVRRSLDALDTITAGGGFLPGDSVTITVVPGSCEAVVQALRRAVEAGAREVSMAPDLRPGRAAEESEDEWVEKLWPVARDLAPASGAHPVSNFRPGQSAGGPCSATSAASVTIDADGSLWSCDALIGLAPETAIDDLEALSTLGDRISGNPSFSTLPDRPECRACSARDSCRLCPHTKLRMNGDGPGEFFCAFVRAMHRSREAVVSGG